jgi:hypothetical protein
VICRARAHDGGLRAAAQFGVSGIVTLVVNEDGTLFQKDLGDDTAALAAQITRFDPDLNWTRIEISGD